jgi:hypothetical protein
MRRHPDHGQQGDHDRGTDERAHGAQRW